MQNIFLLRKRIQYYIQHRIIVMKQYFFFEYFKKLANKIKYIIFEI